METIFVTSNAELPPRFNRPALLIADHSGSSTTREILTRAAEETLVEGVVGWLDLTTPNLVDLLEDLMTIAPQKLNGLRVERYAADELPSLRGLSLLVQYGLGAWTRSEELLPRLQASFPALPVHTLPSNLSSPSPPMSDG